MTTLAVHIDNNRNLFLDLENVYIYPNIPRKKLVNAINSYAHSLSFDDVLLQIDDTAWGGAKEGLIVTNEGIYSKALFETENFMPFSRIEKINAQKTKLVINDYVNWEGNLITDLVMGVLCNFINEKIIMKPNDIIKPSIKVPEEHVEANKAVSQYGMSVLASDIAHNKIISSARLDGALDLGLSLILGNTDSKVDKLHDRFLFLVTSSLKDFRKHVVENSGLIVFKNDFATYDVCSLIYNYTLIQILIETEDERLCQNIVESTFRDKVFSFLRNPQKQKGFTQSMAKRFELYVRGVHENQLTVLFVMSLMGSNLNEMYSSVEMITQIPEDDDTLNQFKLLLDSHLPELQLFMDRLEVDVRDFSKLVLDYKYSHK